MDEATVTPSLLCVTFLALNYITNSFETTAKIESFIRRRIVLRWHTSCSGVETEGPRKGFVPFKILGRDPSDQPISCLEIILIE